MSISSNSVPSLTPDSSSVSVTPKEGLWQRFAGALPAVTILMLLAGIALFGHRTGWKLSHFSALTGQAASQTPADWCAEHNVPESICVECRSDLLPKKERLPWCKRHGLPECPLCHPEVAQLKRAPTITTEQLARADEALAFAERPEPSQQCRLHEKHIQFVSQAAVEKAGIDIAPAWEGSITEAVSANGEIRYDDTRLAHLASRVTGTLWRTERQVGDKVRRGDVLALVDSADVGRTKSEFVQAAAQTQLRQRLLESMRPAFERGAIPEVKFRETEAAAQEAAIRLTTAEQTLANLGIPLKGADVSGLTPDELTRRMQFLGLENSLVQSLDPETSTANLFPLRAPLDGIITERDVVTGEVVDPSQVLFVVADTSRLWLSLDVRIEDAGHLKTGQTVRFRPDGGSTEIAGELDWISTAVDEKTRTVRVRAQLENPDGRLRAGTFGRGRIILREESQALLVPQESVQWEGDCHVVFVRDKNFLKEDAFKLFHVRKVRIGTTEGGQVEIIAGLLPGEIIATTGSSVLRAQLLKSNLGAGCGCHP